MFAEAVRQNPHLVPAKVAVVWRPLVLAIRDVLGLSRCETASGATWHGGPLLEDPSEVLTWALTIGRQSSDPPGYSRNSPGTIRAATAGIGLCLDRNASRMANDLPWPSILEAALSFWLYDLEARLASNLTEARQHFCRIVGVGNRGHGCDRKTVEEWTGLEVLAVDRYYDTAQAESRIGRVDAKSICFGMHLCFQPG
jgi:hypothetical protein